VSVSYLYRSFAGSCAAPSPASQRFGQVGCLWPSAINGDLMDQPCLIFYEWLEEHYVKLLKVALTKELGKKTKLLYKIKMENTYGNKQPFTEQLPIGLQ
jgi:hypothetical protein